MAPVLDALLEEELEAEAEAEEARAAVHGRPHRRLEARLEETLHRGREGRDPRKDDPPCVGDPVEVRREVHVGSEAQERARHGRRVPDTVVDEDDARVAHAVRVPFVEGTSVPVTDAACRSALAADLNTASAA